MYYDKRIYILEGKKEQGLSEIPAWAKAEHMEISVSLAELWCSGYSIATHHLIQRLMGVVRC